MGLEYREIDLNEEPCIFLDCGHFFTRKNMDGVMDMKTHYAMSDIDIPISILKASLPFSVDEVKPCPRCRGSLRSIARYGRIVRRGLLDEATKKFISWSNTEYLRLADRLIDEQLRLQNTPILRPDPADRLKKCTAATGRMKQLLLISNWAGRNRYKSILSLWHQISTFAGQVRKEEQPFQRVSDFVRQAVRQRKTDGDFVFGDSHIQVKGQLQATALLLKCDIVVLSDVMEILKDETPSRAEIKLDLSRHMNDCEALAGLARTTKHPRQEVEGHVYFAQFAAFTQALAPETSMPIASAQKAGAALSPDSDKGGWEALRSTAMGHLAAARGLLVEYKSTEILKPEIEAAEAMLRGGVFYTQVTQEEMRAVYQAMVREFRGTGHWYTCENDYPFTVGECGMPMETTTCPECGARVGGSNYRPVEGVARAEGIEQLATALDRMGL
jgi:hypothetical protein